MSEQKHTPETLSDEHILHLWDIHVGYETGTVAARKLPLSSQDKVAFARAVLAAESAARAVLAKAEGR